MAHSSESTNPTQVNSDLAERIPGSGISSSSANQSDQTAEPQRAGSGAAVEASTIEPATIARLGFENGLDGWDVREVGGTESAKGSVRPGSAILREGDSFLVTAAHDFVVPEDATFLQFTYSNLSFDTTDGNSINDAFEVALLDEQGSSLVHTFATGRDSFINFTEEQPPALAAGVTHDGSQVRLDISSVAPGTPAKVIFRLVNNDQDENTTVTIDSVAIGGQETPPTVSLSVSSATVPETGGIAIFTATLSIASGLPVTVDLGISGSATLNSDYTHSGIQIEIPAGSTSGSITVNAVSDVLDETDETVVVDIAGVTNGTEDGTQKQMVTIIDDDTAPGVMLLVDTTSIHETGGVATFTATLSTVSSHTVSVELGFSGTATNSEDYARSDIQISIPAGSTSGSIAVNAVSDTLDENDETVIVDITSVTNGVESGEQQQTTTIFDDDAPPRVSLSVNNDTISEINGVATFTAMLSAVSSLPVTINVGFAGTASNPADYTASGFQILIPASGTSGNITINAVSDALDENNETVMIEIIGVTNGVEDGVQQQATTILDDDQAPHVTLGLSGTPLTESGGLAAVTATLSAPSGLAVTVHLAFSGTASYLDDYTRSGSSIAILAGALSGSVTLAAVDDLLDESDETVVVDVDAVVNGTENGAQQITATIIDNDEIVGPPPVAPAAGLDDGEWGYRERGTWTTGSGGYKGDIRTVQGPGAGTRTATWTLRMVPPGKYEVFSTWTPGADRTAAAPYRVFIDGISRAVVERDQRVAPGDRTYLGTRWESLGVYTATLGGITVQLSDAVSGGTVVSDGVIAVPYTAPPTAEGEQNASDDQATGSAADIGSRGSLPPLVEFDTNNDGFVSPVDVLAVISHINAGVRTVPSASGVGGESSVDVNSDTYLSPIDALLVINVLNARPSMVPQQAVVSSLSFAMPVATDDASGTDMAEAEPTTVPTVASGFKITPIASVPKPVAVAQAPAGSEYGSDLYVASANYSDNLIHNVSPIAPPTIQVTSPANNAASKVGTTVVVTGLATTDAPWATVASIKLNGQPVGTVDSSGNFLSQVVVQPGENKWTATVTDSRGKTASTTVIVVGGQIGVGTASATITNVAPTLVAGYSSKSAADYFSLASLNSQPEGIADSHPVSVVEGYKIVPYASVEGPWALALAPPGSAFGSDLYVASRHSSDQTVIPDRVYRISPSGTVSLFSTLLPEADPNQMKFPPPNSPFGDFLYVAANNRDGNQPGDSGGAIERIDSSGNWSDFTSLTTPPANSPYPTLTALGEPWAIAFGPGGAFGTDIYVANSTDYPSDIARVNTNGKVTPFVDDGNFSGLPTVGIAPFDVEFGPGGDWGSNLYFTDPVTSTRAIRSVDSAGNVSAPFGTFVGSPYPTPWSVTFGRGGAFGQDMYVFAAKETGALVWYRVQPDGSKSIFSETYGDVVFAADGSAMFAADEVNNTIYKISAIATPTIQVTSPADGAEFSSSSTVVVSGAATTDAPWATVASITLNGQPVGTVDSSGNFFSQVVVQPGENKWTVTVTDSRGKTASTTVIVVGTQPASGSIDFTNISDVSASFAAEYGRTSYTHDRSALYSDVAVRNAGQYPADWPLLMGVTNLSDPAVQVREPDGVTPQGVPYYDFSELVTGATLAPGEATAERTISFFNPNRGQFTYDLVFFGQLNRAPAITTVPDIEALAGRPYQYDVNAIDPDADPVTYELLAGPAGVTMNPQTGLFTWSPLAADTGTHTVTLRARDPRGGSFDQRYTLAVIPAPPNRPPVFTSVPIVSAAVNTPYTYDADATDPDGDPLTYTLITPPTGMTINATTGDINWQPSASQLSNFSITTTASDSRGGTVTQQFTVQVLPEPGNHPPAIISQPVTTALALQPQPLDVVPGFRSALLHSLSLGESVTGLATSSDGQLYIGGLTNISASVAASKIYNLNLANNTTTTLTSALTYSARMVVASGAEFGNDLLHADWNIQSGAGCCAGSVFRTNRTTGVSTSLLSGTTGPLHGDPAGVALGKGGPFGNDLYVMDFEGASLSKPLLGRVSATGTVSVLVNGGPWSETSFPLHIEISSGNGFGDFIYVADSVSEKIWKISPTGQATEFATSERVVPISIRFGSGGAFGTDMYVFDIRGRVLRITTSGDVTSFATGLLTVPAASNSLPDLAFSSDGQTLYVGAGQSVYSIVRDDLRQPYTYDVEAVDPDSDTLNYSLTQSPAGMTIGSTSGEIQWPVPSITPRFEYSLGLGLQPGKIVVTYDTATDAFGNVYVTGFFSGAADFDPGPGVYELTALHEDTFVAKYSSSGALLWADRFGGTGNQGGTGLALDTVGNVLVLGNFGGTSDFDPGPGVANLQGSSLDAFLVKLTSEGQFVWAKHIRTGAYSNGVGTDLAGNVYALGSFTGTLDVVGATGDEIIAGGGGDAYVVKFDPGGNFLWSKAVIGPGFADARHVAIDAAGFVYISGGFRETSDFDPGTAVSNLTSKQFVDDFVWKLTASGQFVWAKQLAGNSRNVLVDQEIKVDRNGDVVVAFAFEGTADFDPGPAVFNLTSQGGLDAYIAKLDSAGNLRWARQAGGPEDDYIEGLDADQFGYIYASGRFTGSGDFDPGPATSLLTSATPGQNELFIWKLNENGAYAAALAPHNGGGLGISVDSALNIYVTGYLLKFNQLASDPNVTVRVDDGRGGFDTQSFTIEVVANRPPEIVSQPVTDAFVGRPYSYDVDATDADSDSLTYSLPSSAPGMTINAGSGLISWTPPRDFTENFDKPNPPDGQILFDAAPIYDGIAGTATGGNSVGNTFENGRIVRSYDVLITADQGGSGFFLHNRTGGGGPFTGEVWGTSTPIAVLPNTSYEFSFYLTNENTINNAIIQPRINGAAIGSAVSAVGTFATHAWQKFTVNWNSGSATTADLSLVNNQSWPDGFGDDFGIDTIKFAPVIPSPSNYNVTVRVEDGRGGFDTQSFTIDVNTAAPGEIRGTTFEDASGNGIRDFGPAVPQVLLNFDELADGTIIGDRYRAQGAVIVNGVIKNYPGFAVSSPNVVFSSNPPVPLTICFPTGAFSAGMNIDSDGYINVRQPQIRAYDIQGNLLGSKLFAQGPDFQSFSFPNPIIHSIQLGSSSPTNHSSPLGSSDSYDNLRFTAAQGETTIAGWPIYLDTNRNGRRDDDERATTTDACGNYSFANLAPGTYVVAEEQRPGWEQTAPVASTYELTVASGQIITGIDFGNRQTNEPQPNRAPAITSTSPIAATVGQLLNYDAAALDPDSDPLTFDLVVKPVGMAVDPTTGIVVWVPTADQVGDNDVVLRVQDGRGGTAMQSFRITVSRPNSTPVITSTPTGPAIVALPYHYPVEAQDADGDTLTYRLDAAPAGMTINTTSGLLIWTPIAGQIRSHHIEITVSDGRGGSTTQLFDLPVIATAPNNPPTITSTPRGTIRIGDAYLYQTIATDPDGDPLTYSLPTAPVGMTIDSAGLVSWPPTAAQLGQNPVQIRVADGRGGVATQSFSVNVVTQATNRPPSITSTPPQAATVGRQYAYDARATDPDGDPLSFALDTAPAGMSIDSAPGTIRWTPTADQLGSQNVVARVFDNLGGYATQTFSIQVRAVNLPPAITSTPPTTAVVSNAYAYAVSASDPEGDTLTFSLTQAPAGMTIAAATGLIEWTPTTAQVGNQSIAVRVTDGQSSAATQSFTVVVSSTAANQPPVITSAPPLTATVGASYTYTVTAADPEGQALLYSLLTAPTGMSVNATTGLVQWTPTIGQIGPAAVTVAAIDPAGNGGTQSFTIGVNDNNRPPQITSAPVQAITAGLPYRYDVRATDPDGDALTFQLDSAPAGMTIDQFGRITWAPAIANIGVNRVAVTVEDPRGTFQTQAFDVAVVADQQTPRVNLVVSQNPVEVGSLVTLVATATDNVGVQSLSVRINGNPVQLDAVGRITLRAEPAGSYAIQASATDAAGNTGLASTSLLVIDTSDVDAPDVEITSPLENTVINAPVDVVGTAADANLLFYTLSAVPIGSENFTELFRGVMPVTNSILGNFDPTGLANDTYILRLTAQDTGGNISTVDQIVQVAGDLKVGNFTLSFTDLTVPVSGIPITVSRTYDSLNAGSGDELGYGWRLEFRDTDLRTSVAPTSDFEQENGIFTPYNQGARVYVTTPGGRREGFTFQPTLVSGFGGLFGFYNPTFVPDPGVTSRLSVQNFTLVRSTSDGLFYGANSLPYNPADKLNFGGEFFLTTKDGIAYEIDANTGDLMTLSDAHQNSLTFSDTAIDSNRGQRVTFERDPQGRITAAVDPAGNKVRYQYDTRGDLTAVTDREGNVTHFVYDLPARPHYLTEVIDPIGRTGVRTEYDTQGRLIKLIDAAGNPVQLVHDPANSVETVVDVLGKSTTFEYDLRGNVVTEVDALGGTTRRTYDAANNMLTETDPLGNTSRFTYDGDGNVLTHADPLGNVTRFTYTTITPGFFDRVKGARPTSLLATTTDPLGNTTTNTYSGTNLISTRDAAGNLTNYTYDAAGNQTSITDAAEGVTRFEYDGRGNLSKQTDALGHVTTFTYDAAGNQLTQTTTQTVCGAGALPACPSGGPAVLTRQLVTTTEYDADGRPTKVIDAEGNTTRTEYDALGNQKATIDALGRRTEFKYDDRGQLVETLFADGTKSTTAYDVAGRRISSTDRAGRVTRYEYDALGRLITTIFPDSTQANDVDNPRSRTEYDAAGRVEAQIDELGHRTEFEYDAAGRQTLVRDALGNTTTTQYDAAGRSISTTDALAHKTQFVYDTLGRQIQTRFADDSTRGSSYDALGRVVTETDQAGRITRFEYDALGRLTAVVDALSQRTEYDYDEAGNLVRQEDAKDQVTRYEYDGLSRRVATVLPLGQRSTTIYDAVGNVGKTTDFNGDTIDFTYDVNNRLTGKAFPDGTSVAFTYAATGQRETYTDSRGVTRWTYDERDRLVSRTDPDGRAISYAYDAAGNRTSVTVPSGTIVYTFDMLNRTETVTDPQGGLTRYIYDAAGRLIRTDLPNGTGETREYDDLNRLTFLENRNAAGVISSYRYTLDDIGNRTRVIEDTGRRVDYAYDALYRLIGEAITDSVAGNRNITYAYDPVGNRLTRSDSAEGVTGYTVDANDRLLTETLAGQVTTYGYDDNGNTLSKINAIDRVFYDWDFENRLVAADTNGDGANDVQYRYDADGIRVSSTSAGQETRYLIDTVQPFQQVIEEYTPGGVIKVSYVHGNDLISQNRPAETGKSFHHVDGLGSTRALTNGSGLITDRYIYDAFGRTIGQVGSTGNVYLFAGEQRDSNIGLDYLRARYLSAGTGRFYGQDPISGEVITPGSFHEYLYVLNNPITRIDPSGRWLEDLILPALISSLADKIAVVFPSLTSVSWKVDRFRIDQAAKSQFTRGNKGDCNKYVKAVANELRIHIPSADADDANRIITWLGGPEAREQGWTNLDQGNRSIDDAIRLADQGYFIIAGMLSTDLSQDHGHVAIAVHGTEFAGAANRSVPLGYWGKLNDPDDAGERIGLNHSFPKDKMLSVRYFAHRLPR